MPDRLRSLLEQSELRKHIEALTEAMLPILARNEMPFFPDYTDHGVQHVGDVLTSATALVPENVWNDVNGRVLFTPNDAAMLIGGALLHDAAMLLQPQGFWELVAPGSRWRPIRWFEEDQGEHVADRPWHELWADYQREARRFSDRTLATTVGERNAAQWKFKGLTPGDQWTKQDLLVVGEFIRRHHARLSHEIAVHGFPGIPAGQGDAEFPALGQMHSKLGDLVGLVARSHGTSLRLCEDYLKEHYGSNVRYLGSAVLYPMALLRVADYLQIGHGRAPAILLKLKQPSSPASVQEWKKNGTIRIDGPDAPADPVAIHFEVAGTISHDLYLQVEELLKGLQHEMDHSTAILSQKYGYVKDLGLDRLVLAKQRVSSDLDLPRFRRELPFVPKPTGFQADPNLLSLLVQPLYGDRPSVGIRELVQNSVDAVRELDQWCVRHNIAKTSLELSDQRSDVHVEFILNGPDQGILRITDKGIGMQSETIQNYFLRAGASFRNSDQWRGLNTGDDGRAIVPRTGRFGVGVFAIFLLGPSFRLWTRHVDESMAFMLEGSVNSHTVPIVRKRSGHPIGTTIEVDLNSETIEKLELKNRSTVENWYKADYPVVEFVPVGTKPDKDIRIDRCASPEHPRPDEGWNPLEAPGFDHIYWRFGHDPTLTCNGFLIGRDPSGAERPIFRFYSTDRFKPPQLSVWDSEAQLALNITRFGLTEYKLPFQGALLKDMMYSFIAHTLLYGPKNYRDINTPVHQPHPSWRDLSFEKDNFSSGMRWIHTQKCFVPLDNGLIPLLGAAHCYITGIPKEVATTTSRRIIAAYPELPDNGATVKGLSFDPRGSSPSQWLTQAYGALTWLKDQSPFNSWPKDFNIIVETTRAPGSEHISGLIPVDDEQGRFWGPKNTKWTESAGDPDHRCFACFESTDSAGIKDLNTVFKSCTGMRPAARLKSRSQTDPDSIFVAQMPLPQGFDPQSSTLAWLWNDCIGGRAIPFDARQRLQLIEQAMEHPRLATHIHRWREWGAEPKETWKINQRR